MINENAYPWLEHYDSTVPPHLVYPEITIPDLLKQTALEFPDTVALILGEKSITYAQLLEKASLLALALVSSGVVIGDRVAICLPNSIEFVVAYYGILLAGGIVAALNPTYPIMELENQVEIVKPKAWLGSPAQMEKLNSLEVKHQFDAVFLTQVDNSFTFVETSSNEHLSTQLITHVLDGELPRCDPNQAAVLQFSGGTTGTPKAAIGLHRNIVANVMQFSCWLTGLRKGSEVFLTAIPLYHVYGMVIGLNVGVAMAATIVLVENPGDTKNIIESIENHNASIFPGVPTLFAQINRFCADNGIKSGMSSLKICISGSAPLPEITKSRFEKLTGATLVEGYGLSEAPTATHCNPIHGENRTGSIGLPLPDVNCRIVSLDDGQTLMAPGEIGELQIQGPQIMQGYFEMESETRQVLKSGWLRTGDIARMDEGGYFYIVGRKKELIKVGGQQVWPNEVEEVLLQIAGIKECAVSGCADEIYGEVVKAWLVIEPGITLDIESLQKYCETRLANYKIPKYFEIIEALPRSSIGKLLRYQLGKLQK